MDQSGLLARLRKNIKLILLIVGLLLLPIIYFAANTQTNLFSRASTPTQSGFVVHRTDPMTGEFFDLIVSTNSFKIVNENNIANKSNVTFRISGDNPKLINVKNLFGGVRQSNTGPYIKTFNFLTEGTGAYVTYTSDNVLLDQNNACIDLHSDANRTNYIATFCYTLSYFSPTSTSGRVYSYTGNPFFETRYTGTKPAGIISMTTAFNKNAAFKGIRVNYFSQDQETNATTFKDLVFSLQGLTLGMTDAQREELCSLDPKYPEKYLRFGRSFWYEGGELIQITEGNGCNFTVRPSYFPGGWMNIWHRNMFLVPTPSQSTSPVPTSISISKTPTTLPSIKLPTGVGSTAIIKPCTPTPLQPAPFATLNTTQPSFSWIGCATATPTPINGRPTTNFGYKLTITGPGIVWNSPPILSTNYKVTTIPFKTGNVYSWSVVACGDGLCSGAKASNPSSARKFSISLPTTSVTKIPSVITTGKPTIAPTRTPTPITQKKWNINIIAECPTGRKLKPNFKPAWYWWDNVDGTDADVSYTALITGPSNRSYNFTMFDVAGSVKAKSAPTGMSIKSQYVSWSGSLPNGNYTVRFEARASSCVAQ